MTIFIFRNGHFATREIDTISFLKLIKHIILLSTTEILPQIDQYVLKFREKVYFPIPIRVIGTGY